jgi:hypothetical protein
MIKFVFIYIYFHSTLAHQKETRKYYERLGVSFSASDEEIKSAFERKLAEMKASGESGYKIS